MNLQVTQCSTVAEYQKQIKRADKKFANLIYNPERIK